MVEIGILDLQGDVKEHQNMIITTLNKVGVTGNTHRIKTIDDMKNCDGLIISGGESSTIGKLLLNTDLYDMIKNFKKPILGTCAGMVLLSKSTGEEQPLLGLINMNIERNGFGRQKMSFEADINIFDKIYHGIFIRAPYAKNIDENVEILSKYNDKIIAVKQNNCIATAFHPELVDDILIHEIFIKEVIKCVE